MSQAVLLCCADWSEEKNPQNSQAKGWQKIVVCGV